MGQGSDLPLPGLTCARVILSRGVRPVSSWIYRARVSSFDDGSGRDGGCGGDGGGGRGG